MQLTLIINSIVCAFGAILGVLFAGASLISIANMKASRAQWLIVAAVMIPALFVISGIGAWPLSARGFHQAAIGLIILPWAHTMIFVLAMLASFKS